MDRLRQIGRRMIPAGAAVLICLFLPGQVALALQLILSGAAICFVLRPLARRLARHMRPATAAILSVVLVLLAVAALAVVALPALFRQLMELIAQSGRLLDAGRGLIDRFGARMRGMGMNVPEPGAIDLSALTGHMGDIVGGTALVAGSVASGGTRAVLSVMLGAYFLIDYDSLMLQVELMIPSRARRIVLRMAGEAGRGLRRYLRGQLTVALIVGLLTSTGLWLIGVKSPLILGAVIGLTNLVPYFGPIIGGVPAVLTALSQDLITALMAVAVLFIVQQIDGIVISPRVMSGVTGLPPYVMLLALAVGGSGWGFVGMLLALPVVVIVRICFRVWATRNEVIEKPPDV
ncbi:MAG: AI-2E family transporter [Christensenellaceae bacterium]|nr:AI-2E family transporter [Christensenellaceae bacterium]MEA5069888.1 AI-2E family transporter [Christensenellaceae bacterium]